MRSLGSAQTALEALRAQVGGLEGERAELRRQAAAAARDFERQVRELQAELDAEKERQDSIRDVAKTHSGASMQSKADEAQVGRSRKGLAPDIAFFPIYPVV